MSIHGRVASYLLPTVLAGMSALTGTYILNEQVPGGKSLGFDPTSQVTGGPLGLLDDWKRNAESWVNRGAFLIKNTIQDPSVSSNPEKTAEFLQASNTALDTDIENKQYIRGLARSILGKSLAWGGGTALVPTALAIAAGASLPVVGALAVPGALVAMGVALKEAPKLLTSKAIYKLSEAAKSPAGSLEIANNSVLQNIASEVFKYQNFGDNMTQLEFFQTYTVPQITEMMDGKNLLNIYAKSADEAIGLYQDHRGPNVTWIDTAVHNFALPTLQKVIDAHA
jgi:hypothetical protein